MFRLVCCCSSGGSRGLHATLYSRFIVIIGREDQPGMRKGLLMGEIGVWVGFHGYTGNDALPG